MPRAKKIFTLGNFHAIRKIVKTAEDNKKLLC